MGDVFPSSADTTAAKYARRRSRTMRKERRPFRMPWILIPISFLLVEIFSYCFLRPDGPWSLNVLWPLIFGGVWTVMLTALVRLLPGLAGRISYAFVYFISAIYAVVQTGYFLIFQEMLWISDFRYASEGSDYLDTLLTFPLEWWAGFAGLLILGVVMVWKYPQGKFRPVPAVFAAITAAAAIFGCLALPEAVFLHDEQIKHADSDYGRAQSAEAAYDNMFNAHRLYQVCGIYQTGIKDVFTNYLYPLTPGHAQAQAAAQAEIDAYFENRGHHASNDMTGLFAGKNVIFVLMESMDDWTIGEHTPTISRLMAEGINFTNFYTPGYGGVRTFNSEFCTNTGSYLASTGGYAFDYVTNHFDQSLAHQLGKQGYSSIVYHYNDPAFYSRGVFSPAMGYDQYLSYQDYITGTDDLELYDDEFLFNNEAVSQSFFREGPKLNFIITRSAHMNYKYNDVLSYYGLLKYPQYRGLTGSEDEDCMYLKARLVDDVFTRLLAELEAHGELDNTVIVAITDHYTYGFKDEALMMDRSGVDHQLLLEKTPCFIWSTDCPDLEVTKTLNTADFLPTVLNLMGVEFAYDYLGQDAFDPNYPGYALFPDGSWVSQGIAVSVDRDEPMILSPDAPEPTQEFLTQMSDTVLEFIRINNLILETDYYKSK